MRTPWGKTMVKQLDLLGETATVSTARSSFGELNLDALDAEFRPLSPAPDLVAVKAETTTETASKQALVAAIDSLVEDPANPRTEFPDALIDELAEDIRQHGILQPIVVHPADASGAHRLHFGAMRLRAAKRAGLRHVPIAVRMAAADPYAQVAENQKRCPLQPIELARFIRGRSAAGDSNATIAKRLGMDLTTVAHHLALLDLPPVLDDAFKARRCTSPRTLYELSKLHEQDPAQVDAWVSGHDEITRSAVAALRADAPLASAQRATAARSSPSLINQINASCTRLEGLVARLKKANAAKSQVEVEVLRRRLADLVARLT